VERGLVGARRTDRLLVRVKDVETLSDDERRVIAAFSHDCPTDHYGRLRPEELMTGGGMEHRQIQKVRTPTGELALVRQTAEKLLAEGVLSGTLDGDLHAADAATVKAAIMASAVCDFCSSPGATHYFDVPDFNIGQLPNNYGAGRSTGGWMACDACDELVRADKREALTDRAVNNMAFPKFSRGAVKELLAKFWRGMDERAEAAGIAGALVDYVEDRLPPRETKVEGGTRGTRLASVMNVTGLDARAIDRLAQGRIDRETVTKLVAWRKAFGLPDPAQIADLILKGQRPPLPNVVPHWQRALDAKFDAIAKIDKAVRAADFTFAQDAPTDLRDPAAIRRVLGLADKARRLRDMDFATDLKHLRAAEAFSFNAETIDAITAAAQLVPHESPLSSVEIPTGAGWFWFSQPLPIVSSNMASDFTHALLWGWDDEDHYSVTRGVTLRFSTYVVKERGEDKGQVIPATRWHWPLTMSFEEMLVDQRTSYRHDYGPGGPYHGLPYSIGEEPTMKCVADLSLFFLSACMWFKQKILVQSAGHVERHARKRLQREHKLAEPPAVRVIALRASMRQPAEGAEPHAPDGTGKREYHCRWIVSGHPRLQRCGPGRKDVKLIWIAPHPAGPEGKPFRKRERVYAVIR